MILAIESSCDETSVALVVEGPQVVSEVTSSQDDIHGQWGGVVPELASRSHQETLLPLVAACLEKASVGWKDLDAIAVAHKPGLLGPLLVGVTLAKSLSYALGKPLIGVDHLQGHMASVQLENKVIDHDSIGLLVSGGHTLILQYNAPLWNIMGGTRDDAAGEAFDKGARLLGLPYPGGPHLSRLADQGDRQKIIFPFSDLDQYQLSFSGLKSELRRRVESGLLNKERVEDVASGYQEAIVETLIRPMVKLIRQKKPKNLVVAGGVSRNQRLRDRLSQLSDGCQCSIMFPEPKWCTDNAAMIGAAACEKFKRQEFDDYSLDASARINPRELLAKESL